MHTAVWTHGTRMAVSDFSNEYCPGFFFCDLMQAVTGLVKDISVGFFCTQGLLTKRLQVFYFNTHEYVEWKVLP